MNGTKQKMAHIINGILSKPDVNPGPIEPYSLYISTAGKVLLNSVCDQWMHSGYPNLQSDLDEILEFMQQDDNPNCNFSNGISGSAWLLNYLDKKGLIALDDDFFDDIDQVLAVAATNYLKIGCYDHFQGAVGIILTLLARPDKNKLLLERLLDDLLKIRMEYKGYKIWRFVYLSDEAPHILKISLGLSHGLPSLLVILSKLYKANIKPQECMSAMEELYSFLQSIKQPKTKGSKHSFYPGVIREDQQTTYITKLGWCYGDLGIASAYYVTGSILNHKEMLDEAEAIFLYYSGFLIDSTEKLFDGCFCHGAAGTMHLYRRMYLNTGNPVYKKTYEYWLAEVLKLSEYSKESGFMFVGENESMTERTSLIDGTKGIGLVLSSYLADEIPDWDECFLLS